MNKLPKIDPNQVIAIDLETCDPELLTLAPGYITNVGFIAGIAIAAKEGSFYIPIRHAQGENYDIDTVIKWLNYTLSANTPKVFHNAQYDLGWLKYEGVEVYGSVFDTMLAAALLDENRKQYGLDSIGKEYLNEGKNEIALETAVKAFANTIKTEKKVIRLKENSKYLAYKPFWEAKIRVSQHYDIWPDVIKNQYKVCGKITNARGQEKYKIPTTAQKDIKALLWAVDPAEMGSYPIQDVDLTYRLYHTFLPLLEQEGLMTVMNLENELMPCLLEMREQGVKIDIEKAVELDIKYTKLIDECQEKINKIAGKEINVDADSDLVDLCAKLNLVYQVTAKGNPCFSAQEVPKHEVFDLVLELRKLNKARNTYIRGYYFGSSYNERLHGQYNQLKSDEGGTVTGRLSSSNPNLQNIPARGELGKEMRALFVPDTEDEQWLCMDFSGQEPKMLCNLVLMLDKKFGTRQVKNLATGEIELVKEEGFPGADLARLPEFSGREADFHTAVATKCMEVENKAHGRVVTPEELAQQAKEFRTPAKSIGLGIMYGSGNKKVAEEMTKKGYPMTEQDAANLRASVYAGVPFLDAINKYVMDLAKRRGYVLTLLKRKGRFDIWEVPVYKVSRDSYKPKTFRSQAEAFAWLNTDECTKFVATCGGELGRPQRAFTYKALNKIIQGSSADQTKTAMLHIYKRSQLHIPSLDIYYRRAAITPPKMRAQVHDELNFSIDRTENVQWFQDTMENSLPLLVQSVAEPGVGKTWADAKH